MQEKAFGRNRRTVSYVTCHKSLEGGPNFFFSEKSTKISFISIVADTLCHMS